MATESEIPGVCPQASAHWLVRQDAIMLRAKGCSIRTIGQNFNGVVYRCSKHDVAFTEKSLQTAVEAAKEREAKRLAEEAARVK